MSTTEKFVGDGFTDYRIVDAHGPRGSIRLDCDGTIQMTPATEHIGTGDDEFISSIGTLWLAPEDGEVYREVVQHLQKFSDKVLTPAEAVQEPLHLAGVAG